MAGFTLGANYWSRRGGPRMWSEFDAHSVQEEVAWAADLGLKTLRWFLYWPDFEPRPGEQDVQCWENVAQFLNMAAAKGLETFPTLLVGHMSGQNWDPSWREGRNLWEDPWMLDREEDFIRTAVAKLHSAPTIAGWVLTNEWPLYAGVTTPGVFARWIRRMVAAVRENDPQRRPITMGDGLWNAMGADTGIQVDMLADSVDIVGPHVYPEEANALNVAMASYVHCMMAQGSKPVLLEEFGTTDAFGSPEGQAQFYRSQLAGALMAGAIGAWSWSLTDFDLPHVLPYAHHPFELTFGLLTTTGKRKATAETVHDFVKISRQFGTPKFDRMGIVIPALQTGIIPFERGPEGSVQTDVARTMLQTLAQMGWNPRVLRESLPPVDGFTQSPPVLTELGGCDVVFLVAPRIGEPLRERLWDWVKQGGHLYIAYSHTMWFPDLPELLGVEHSGLYNVKYSVAGTQNLMLKSGGAVEFDASQNIAYLPLKARGANLVGELSGGEGALFQYAYGQGSIVTSAVGWELSEDLPHGLQGLYGWYLKSLGFSPAISIQGDSTQVAISESGQVLAINHGDRPSAIYSAKASGTLRLEDGTPAGESVMIGPHCWWHGTWTRA